MDDFRQHLRSHLDSTFKGAGGEIDEGQDIPKAALSATLTGKQQQVADTIAKLTPEEYAQFLSKGVSTTGLTTILNHMGNQLDNNPQSAVAPPTDPAAPPAPTQAAPGAPTGTDGAAASQEPQGSDLASL